MQNKILSIVLFGWFYVSYAGFPDGSVSKESAWNEGDTRSVPGLGRSPGEGNDNPHQYSSPDNPTDSGAL